MIKLRNVSYYLFCFTMVFLAMRLSFLAESSYIQTKYINLVLFLMLVFSSITDIKKAKNIIFDSRDIFLWAYVLILAVGVYLAENREIAINKYYIYAFPILIVYFLFKSNFYLIKDKNKVAMFISTLAGIVSIIAILEFIFHKNIIYEYFIPNTFYSLYITNRRVMSTQQVPQVLGTYLVACIPMALFTIYNTKRYLSRVFGIVVVILCSIALVLTFSRGPLFALVISLTVYFYRKCRKIIKPFLILIVIFTILFSFYGSDTVAWRLGLKGWIAHSDYQHRWTRIGTIIRILKDHPFIGLGLENYRWSFDKYFFIKDIQWDWRVTDNMYLLILGESGILGFLAFVVFVFLLLKRAYRRYSEFGFVLFVALIAILCNMMTYDMLYWTVPFYIFWIYCGMLSSITHEKSV